MTSKRTVGFLVATCVVMLALPALASANWSVTPGNVTFSGTGGAGILVAPGEPAITCEGPSHLSGAYDGSGTTGTAAADLTGCHLVVLGFTIKCRTTGGVLDNTVATSGAFHNVTITNGKRAILMTLTKTTLRCGATKPLTMEGSMIGEVTAPTGACPLKTTTATGSAFISGGLQGHTKIDGDAKEYYTTVTTEGGAPVKAAEEGEGTLAFSQEVTIDCV
jgi:hypothetical protein